MLTWTGDLAVGASATITYTATVHNPDTGDVALTNAVTSPTPGSNCPAGGTDPRCSVTVKLVGVNTLTFTMTPGAPSAAPGQVVALHGHGRELGADPLHRWRRSPPRSAASLDDATYNGDATATGGTVTYTAPNLTWVGTVPAGGTITVTYSVTVNNPDAGNHILAGTLTSASPNSDCPAGSADPRCAATVTVSELTIDSALQPGHGHTRHGGERDDHDRQHRADPLPRDQRQLHHRQHRRPAQRRRQRDRELRDSVDRRDRGGVDRGTSRSAAR